MADASSPASLSSLLAAQLPRGVPFTFYHYSTPPARSSALFAAPPHGRAERTYCESHFLAASVVPSDAPASPPPEELLVLAIEALVYTTRNLTTIFVAKADSTGCLSALGLPRSQSASPLKAICGTFVAWLARERQREGKKLVVSLFARAQDQYLFPASIENPDKHVLDDRGLVKWWCRVLDPVVGQYRPEDAPTPFPERLGDGDRAAADGTWSPSDATAKGYLVIPGFEPHDTLRYIPPPPSPATPRRWAATHPLLEIAPHPAAPPRCLVPHFPDDPKARFLDELDEELPDRGTDALAADGGTPSRSNGQWKSVKTLDQFWDFMAFRQECSSGRIVGFIWVVITPPKPSIPEEDEHMPSQQSLSQCFSQNDSQESMSTPRKTKAKTKTSNRRRKTNLEYGPIPLVLPRIKTGSSSLSSTSNTSNRPTTKLLPESSPYFKWPVTSRGTICFSTKDYNRAHEVLIHQSFANRDAAARSTKKWKEEIAVLGGVSDGDWSWTVIGTKPITEPTCAPTNGVVPAMVMGVRKKKKPESTTDQEKATNGVQVLGDGLVRKKRKPETTTGQEKATDEVQVLGDGLVKKKAKVELIPDAGASAANGVNTLGASLVREKAKN